MKTRILLFFVFLLPCCVANAQWVQVWNSWGIFCFGVNNNNLFACTDGYPGILRSSDDGKHWTPINAGLKNFNVRAITISNNTLFVSTDSGLFSSSDNGSNWMPFAPSIVSTILSISFRGDDIFVGTSDALVLSIDGGKSWVISHLTGSPAIKSILFTDTNILIGSSNGLYISSDNGSSWDRVSLLNQADVFSFVLNGKNIIAMTDEGLFQSIDGKNWTAFGLNSVNIYSVTIIGANIFAGSIDGFYLSTDDGNTWAHSTDSIFTKNYIYALTAKDNYIFAGTWVNGSIWRRPLSEFITSAVPSSNQPSEFHLTQNFPNPFSESTTIRFDIPERTAVSLKVYDITGREVAVLTNETLDAGSYTRSFNAEGIPSGTYVCRLEAGSYREARTLQVLR